jgi:hypothetical protein
MIHSCLSFSDKFIFSLQRTSTNSQSPDTCIWPSLALGAPSHQPGEPTLPPFPTPTFPPKRPRLNPPPNPTNTNPWPGQCALPFPEFDYLLFLAAPFLLITGFLPFQKKKQKAVVSLPRIPPRSEPLVAIIKWCSSFSRKRSKKRWFN